MLNAPPSGVDATADVALLLGLVAGLRDDAERPTATMPFADAVTDLRAAVRHGPGARPRWPGIAGDARTVAATRADCLTYLLERVD